MHECVSVISWYLQLNFSYIVENLSLCNICKIWAGKNWEPSLFQIKDNKFMIRGKYWKKLTQTFDSCEETFIVPCINARPSVRLLCSLFYHLRNDPRSGATDFWAILHHAQARKIRPLKNQNRFFVAKSHLSWRFKNNIRTRDSIGRIIQECHSKKIFVPNKIQDNFFSEVVVRLYSNRFIMASYPLMLEIIIKNLELFLVENSIKKWNCNKIKKLFTINSRN